MAIYTYQVDHGDKTPRVGGADTYNGDPIQAVCFDAALDNASKAREILEDVISNHIDIGSEVIAKIQKAIDLI